MFGYLCSAERDLCSALYSAFGNPGAVVFMRCAGDRPLNACSGCVHVFGVFGSGFTVVFGSVRQLY